MIELRLVRAVYNKEFKDSLRSSTFLVVIMLPVILAMLFTFLLGGPVASSSHIAVFTEGETAFAEMLDEAGNLEVEKAPSWEDAEARVKDGDVSAALRIPANFDTTVELGTTVELDMVYDEAKSRQTNLAVATIEALLEDFAGRSPVAVVKATPIRKFKAGQLMLPVWITFAVALIGITLMATNVAEEKENGTMDAVLVTPVSRTEVMLAKALFGTVLVLVSVLLITVLNGVIGSHLILLMGLALLGGFGMVSLGLLIGALSRDQRQASTLSTVIYLPIILPVFVLGLNPVIDAIAHVLPTYYLWHGANTLLFSENISGVWVDFVVLFGFAVALIAVAATALRRR